MKNNRLLWNVFSMINILWSKKLFSTEHTVVCSIYHSIYFRCVSSLSYVELSHILAWHVCVLMKNVIYFDLSALLKLLRHYRSDTLEEWKFNMTMSSCHDFKIPCYWAGFVWVIALIQVQKLVFSSKCRSLLLFRILIFVKERDLQTFATVKGHTPTEYT